MPEGHRHLTREERCQMRTLRESGLLVKPIARQRGRDRTTVWREIQPPRLRKEEG